MKIQFFIWGVGEDDKKTKFWDFTFLLHFQDLYNEGAERTLKNFHAQK